MILILLHKYDCFTFDIPRDVLLGDRNYDIPRELFVMRGCALPGAKVGCKESWDTDGEVLRKQFNNSLRVSQCVCDAELCNSAVNHEFTVSIGGITALLIMQFTRKDL